MCNVYNLSQERSSIAVLLCATITAGPVLTGKVKLGRERKVVRGGRDGIVHVEGAERDS